MIPLTRLNKDLIYVNLTSIQYLERTPETLVVFNNGDRLLVREPVEEVLALAKAYQSAVFNGGEAWISRP